MSRVFIVDDEPTVLAAFADLLAAQGYDVTCFNQADEAFERLDADPPDVAILDIRMPGTSGLEALRRIKQRHSKMPVILMTGQGTVETAIEATKLGAFDYQLKPFDPAQMLSIVEQALESARLMRRSVSLDPETLSAGTSDAIVGQSASMQQVYKAIGRVAQTDATVLIRGESGTGKELVARAIYQHSLRKEAPLLAVSCVAIPETLLESELFGYERGAFTGAAARRIGKFEQANGGTIFLDEIGDIPIGVQAKILRVLQEKSFERIGGNETINVNIRVLAATNRNLEKAIAEGHFREDLFHRLNVVTINLPPLRKRREDLPAMVDYFRDRFARDLGIEKVPVSKDAMELLQEHSWPGNVRELEHCIQRAMIFTRGHSIQESDVRRALEQSTPLESPFPPTSVDTGLLELVQQHLELHSGSGAHETLLEKVDKLLLVEALRRTNGNQSQAAKLLGLPRPTLHAKMQRHSIRIATDILGN